LQEESRKRKTDDDPGRGGLFSQRLVMSTTNEPSAVSITDVIDSRCYSIAEYGIWNLKHRFQRTLSQLGFKLGMARKSCPMHIHPLIPL